MLSATTAMRTHTRSRPSPRRTLTAPSHGAGATQRTSVRMRRMSARAHDVATQCMRTCRSQCNGDRIHPVWGRNGPAPPLRPPSSRPTPASPAKPDRAAALQSPARANPHPDFGGSENVGKKSPRDYARVDCAFELGPCDGAAVQVRGAKHDGGARWSACMWHVGCTTDSVQPATIRNRSAQRPAWSCPRACPSTFAHACTCGCLQHTCSLTTLPSAQSSQCCQRLQPCARTRGRSHRPAVRTRARNRTPGVLHGAPLCE